MNHNTQAAKALNEKRIPAGIPVTGAVCAYMLLDKAGNVRMGPDVNGDLQVFGGLTAMNYVGIGDSRTDPGNNTWFDRMALSATALANVTKHNLAISGQTSTQMLAAAAWHAYAPLITGIRALCGTWGVTNDLTDPAVLAATVIANMKAMWNAQRADGFYPVIGFTETPRSDGAWSGTSETHRGQYNTAVRALTLGATDAPDILIDVDALFPNPNGADYSDNLHLTAAAQQKLSSYVSLAINRLSAIYGIAIQNPTVTDGSFTNPSLILASGSATQITFHQLANQYSLQASNLADCAVNLQVSEVGAGDKFAWVDVAFGDAFAVKIGGVEKFRVKANTIHVTVPTSASGLSSGDVWSNLGILTIVS